MVPLFGIWGKIGVWVDIDDEERAGRIDTRIDARIATELEQGPAGQRKLAERFGKFGRRAVPDRKFLESEMERNATEWVVPVKAK